MMGIQNDWKTLGSRLRHSRMRSNLTTQEVAQRLSEVSGHINRAISRRHIEYWEILGTLKELKKPRYRDIHPEELIELIRIYEVNLLWLLLYNYEPSLRPERPNDEWPALLERVAETSTKRLNLIRMISELSEPEIDLLHKAFRILSTID